MDISRIQLQMIKGLSDPETGFYEFDELQKMGDNLHLSGTSGGLFAGVSRDPFLKNADNDECNNK